MSRPLKGFITYAHKNTTAKDELIMRLAVMQQRNDLVTWHDAEMTGGTKWHEDIFKHLADSDILLYLVSAASLASKNCNKELAEAVSSDIRIIPIILEDCDWQHHQLSDFQAFPDKGKPINEWEPESRGWQNVVAGIRKVVDKVRSQMDNSSGASEKELRAELAFQHGNIFMMIGQINMAIKHYSDAIKLKPDYTDAYGNCGFAYITQGKIGLAITNFNKAIELKPDYAEAYNNRGAAYLKKGEFDLAIEDHTKAIELKPNYAIAYYNRGRAYGLKGKIDLAIEDHTKAIELKPDYAEAYNNRGAAYLKKGEFDLAIEDHTKAIELKPNYAIAYYNRGRAYGVKSDVDSSASAKLAVISAIKDYNPAIGLNPELAPAYYNRGVAWLRLREWERAESDLAVARNMGIDIIASFHNDHESVEVYERRNRVKLPEDIASMLTQRRRSRFPKTEKFLSAKLMS